MQYWIIANNNKDLSLRNTLYTSYEMDRHVAYQDLTTFQVYCTETRKTAR